jgi:hypothetical protein
MNMRATCFDINFLFLPKYVFKERFCARILYMPFIHGVIIKSHHTSSHHQSKYQDTEINQ